MTRIIETEEQLLARLRQMDELLEQERGAIVNADTDSLEMLAAKKQELTNILATVPSELIDNVKNAPAEDHNSNRRNIVELVSSSRAKNSINGSMLTQAKNMTEKSIGILLSCTEKNPVELYDEEGRVADPARKREFGSA